MMKIDPNSFLLGAVVALGVLFLSGAAGAGEDPGKEPDGVAADRSGACCCCPCRELGRYALTFSGQRAYLLDRETGQVWEKYAPANAVGSSSDFNDPKQ